MIEDKIPGKSVEHLCYPYYVGSQLAIEMSKEVGYKCNYWGFLDGRSSNQAGDNPLYSVRLSDELVFRLPGKGRLSLQQMMMQRITKNSKRLLSLFYD
jgi:hypothetical protein